MHVMRIVRIIRLLQMAFALIMMMETVEIEVDDVRR